VAPAGTATVSQRLPARPKVKAVRRAFPVRRGLVIE
jgi:hypothetical protein